MKKIVSFMLIACLAAMCFATTSFAATGNAVVTSSTASKGETVVLTVSLGDNTALGCYGATLSYDNTALKLVDMQPGTFCAAANVATAKATGFSMTGDVTSGTLFTATFEVLAVKGDYKVDVVFDEKSTTNSKQEKVAMTTAAGTIKVVCNHAYDAGVVTKEATCTEAGVKTFTCTKCDETKTEAIKALGHKWTEEVTKAATCTEDGEKTITCANCKETKTEVIKATGHSWNWVIDQKPTVDAEGEKHEECANCGEKRNEGTKIDKLDKPVDDVVKTGDASNVAVAGALCLAAAAAAFVFTKKRG